MFERESSHDPEGMDPLAIVAEVTQALSCSAGSGGGGFGEALAAVDSQDLMEASVEVQRCRAKLAALEANVLVELETRRCTETETGLTTAQYVAQCPAQPSSETKKRLRVARKVNRWFPQLASAMTAGRVSWDHAELMVRVSNARNIEALAEIESQLVEAAEEMIFAHWAANVRGLARLLDEDGGHNPDADLASNKLHVGASGDGVFLRGELTGTDAVLASEVINSVADELHSRFQIDRHTAQQAAYDQGQTFAAGIDMPSRATLCALAFVEICRRARRHPAADTVSDDEASDDHEANDNGGTAPRTSRPAVITSIVLRAEELGLHPGLLAHTRNGLRFTQAEIEALRCEEHIRAIITDAVGAPVHVGRARRLATATQREALRVRDGGCTFPGCDTQPDWGIAHHVIPWSQGGTTDLDNLALLCHHHHGLTHSRGWQMKSQPNHRFQWTTPTGTTLNSQQHGRSP